MKAFPQPAWFHSRFIHSYQSTGPSVDKKAAAVRRVLRLIGLGSFFDIGKVSYYSLLMTKNLKLFVSEFLFQRV